LKFGWLVELGTVTVLRIGQIPEDDLPLLANPGLLQVGISKEDLLKSAQQPKAIFQGRAFSACLKPELIMIGIYKLIFQE
jgi:hypothetical protein